MTIQHFTEINESHAATGFGGRTDLPSFHIFRLEDTYPDTRKIMMPYRMGFYQVVFLQNSADAVLQMNDETLHDLNNHISFASPRHVLAWMRGKAQQVYIVYFKREFLVHLNAAVEDTFPYFRITDSTFAVKSRE